MSASQDGLVSCGNGGVWMESPAGLPLCHLTMSLCWKHADAISGDSAVLSGMETVDIVTVLFKASNFNGFMNALEGTTVAVKGKKLSVRIFLYGDHMLQYKAT